MSVQFIFAHCKMFSIQRRVSYCGNRDAIILLLAFATSSTGYQLNRGSSTRCACLYKCLHQSAPIYLSELIIPVAASAKRSHLRSAVYGNLIISYCRTKRYGQRSFAFSGPALWNSLPLTVRDPLLSLTQFARN